MDSSPKSRSRRAEIRKNRPDTARLDWQALNERGIPASVAIAAAFFVIAYSILLLRQDVVRYHPDQPINHDIVSRVGFEYTDGAALARAEVDARQRSPRVFDPVADDQWADLEKDLLALPERVSGGAEVPADLKDLFSPGAITALRDAAKDGRDYKLGVAQYVERLRQPHGGAATRPLILLDPDERREDVRTRRNIRIGADEYDPVRQTFRVDAKDELRPLLTAMAEQCISSRLQVGVVEFTLARLRPTHALNKTLTAQRANEAAAAVDPRLGNRFYHATEVLVPKSKRVLSVSDWQLLRAENARYVASLKGSSWKPKVGVACLVAIVTVVLAAYVYQFQPRVVRNHMRGIAITALLLSMLLLAQLAGIGNAPIYLLGIAPTLLVSMILTIAYDKRFSVGVAGVHGLLVTVALGQGVGFFVILWVGVLTASFLLNDIRTRSKLIEVGGAASIAMMAAAAAEGLLELEGGNFVMRNCLYAGAAGLSVGFVVLGILPFIEKAFKITTSMSLLELADVSQPLLRRLAMEAPGTYQHSLQVATLAETAAEAIGANSLMARVGAYYHDVGKMNKADYFIENQMPGQENRHLNLNPSVSLLVIVGHVKDGVELAREYNLPPVLVQFIQQHHGTTLVEYFYHRACTQKGQPGREGEQVVEETQYRYPGPKPRSKEVAIVMLADAIESATRSINEPTASRVETLVHDLALKRLMDGQFDECELTMRDLERIERSMTKTLIGIHHGRIAYPSTSGGSANAGKGTGTMIIPPARTA